MAPESQSNRHVRRANCTSHGQSVDFRNCKFVRGMLFVTKGKSLVAGAAGDLLA